MLYVRGWRPKYLAKPLVLGAAFHLGKALWYQGKSEKTCIGKSLEYVESVKTVIELKEDYEEILFRVRNLLHYWIERLGEMDKQEFNILYVEKELRVPLGDSFIMTIRPDAILESKATGAVYIMETKTTSFSKKLTEEAVLYGDQAIAYAWGVKKVLGLDVDGVIPDIAYWNKTTRNISNIEYVRGEIIKPTTYQLELFESNMIQLFSEATQKVLALKQKYRADLLFPRNTYYCMSYFSLCPYADVCRTDAQARRQAPKGFTVDKGKNLGDLCWDELGI